MSAEKKLPEAKRKKILAVDDEEEVLAVYKLFLTNQGYDVAAVADADQCIEQLQKNTPDVILLDVNMPKVGGLILLQVIRASAEGKDIPIIMISARRDEQTIKIAGELGCDNFIVKPFNLKELAKRIAMEFVEVDFPFIQNAVANMRVPKAGMFGQPGLGEFNSLSADCYPFTDNGFEFCVVIQRGMRPTGLKKATEQELREKIRVFFKHPIRWREVWP